MNLLPFIFLFFVSLGYSQNINISIEILDKKTLLPIKGVSIEAKHINKLIISDSKGKISFKILNKFLNDSVVLKKKGYDIIYTNFKTLQKESKIYLKINSIENVKETKLIDITINSSRFIEQKGQFRLEMPKKPTKSDISKIYPEGEAIGCNYSIVPDFEGLSNTISENDTTKFEIPIYLFGYMDFPAKLIENNSEELIEKIIENVEKKNNIFELKYKNRNIYKFKSINGIEVLYESKQNDAYMKAYIFRIKNRIYTFSFMQVYDYCTQVEIENYLNKFELLDN